MHSIFRALADNTGGCNGNVGFRNAGAVEQLLCHGGAFSMPSGAQAFALPALANNDSACYAILEVLHGNVQRSRLNAIHRKVAAAVHSHSLKMIAVSSLVSAFLDAAAHASPP